MRLSERITPLGAAISALSLLVCCLPISFAGALGAASLGAVMTPLRPWLLGLSACLLAVGFIQVYRRRPSCERPSTASVAILWLSAVLVTLVLLLPQLLASVLASWFE